MKDVKVYKATLSIFYGQRVLRHVQIVSDKKKKQPFTFYFYFFLRHDKKKKDFFSVIDI